jgi:hypothetical protein
MAPSIYNPFGAVTDASYVYWLSTDGSLRKVHK